jgi:hypothetical protein
LALSLGACVAGSLAAPPAALVGASVVEGASVLVLGVPSPPVVEASLDLAAVVLVVALVEVVCAAAASALVFVGGVMSGVLLGTESVTVVLPPQAPSAVPHSNAALAASTALVLTTVPYACRR